MADFLWLLLTLFSGWQAEEDDGGEETDAALEEDTGTQDGDADATRGVIGTGFPFVGELRGESDGEGKDLLENEDEDDEDDEERDELLLLPSRMDWFRRIFRSLRPIGAARVRSSSVRATARRGAGIMD